MDITSIILRGPLTPDLATKSRRENKFIFSVNFKTSLKVKRLQFELNPPSLSGSLFLNHEMLTVLTVYHVSFSGELRNNCLMFDLISRVRFFLGVRVLLGYNSLLAARGFK